MDSFLNFAQEIFDTARAEHHPETADFALLILPDGGLHMIMEGAFALDSAAAQWGARAAYRVTRTEAGVRVEGKRGIQSCVLSEERGCEFRKALLRDQPFYRMTSPLLNSPGPASPELPTAEAIFREKRGELASMMPQSM